MNLVADEGVDRQTVERLRADGHSVHIEEMSKAFTVIEPGRVRVRRSLLKQATEPLTRLVKK